MSSFHCCTLITPWHIPRHGRSTRQESDYHQNHYGDWVARKSSGSCYILIKMSVRPITGYLLLNGHCLYDLTSDDWDLWDAIVCQSARSPLTPTDPSVNAIYSWGFLLSTHSHTARHLLGVGSPVEPAALPSNPDDVPVCLLQSRYWVALLLQMSVCSRLGYFYL